MFSSVTKLCVGVCVWVCVCVCVCVCVGGCGCVCVGVFTQVSEYVYIHRVCVYIQLIACAMHKMFQHATPYQWSPLVLFQRHLLPMFPRPSTCVKSHHTTVNRQ